METRTCTFKPASPARLGGPCGLVSDCSLWRCRVTSAIDAVVASPLRSRVRHQEVWSCGLAPGDPGLTDVLFGSERAL